MKSLHKKLSAMLLAGVVVIGGVVGSGVSSFAASAKVARQKAVQESYQDKIVKNIVKCYGDVIVLKSDKDANQFIGECSKRDLYNLGRKVKVKNPYEIPRHLQDGKYSKKKFAKIQYNDSLYLIKIK